MSQVLVIIPARGGSKGIPRKNLQLVGGKPLLAWPIDLALSIKQISRVIVSSDDEEMLTTAHELGAETMKRPAKLAGDDVPTLPVLQHVLQTLDQNEGYKPDIILLMYPSCPFLKKQRVEEALKLFETTNCNTVLGVKKVRGLVWKFNSKLNKFLPEYPRKRVNRQLFQPLYEEAGNIFFSRYTVLMDQDQIVDPDRVKFVFVSEDEQLDIDTPADLEQARQLVATHRV